MLHLRRRPAKGALSEINDPPHDPLPPGPGRRKGDYEDVALNPWLEGRLARYHVAASGPVLDLGCGRGFWLRRMSRSGVDAIGIEPAVERASGASRQGRVAVAEGAHLPLVDGSVDLVWSVHVLHHLDDPGAVLAEVARVLRPGGHLVIAETVEDNPLIRLGRRFHPHWDGVDVISRFRSSTLIGLLASADLDVVDLRQHSLLSFVAWALPFGDWRAWSALCRIEDRLPVGLGRWGAHVEAVARRR